ncbi:hypothetical protein HK405_015663, partial [Cladochytrium tenue]
MRSAVAAALAAGAVAAAVVSATPTPVSPIFIKRAPRDSASVAASAAADAAVEFNPHITWDQAVARGQALAETLGLEDKVRLATGVGWTQGPCVGNIAAVPAIDFQGLCLQDSPTGVRFALNVSAFPAAMWVPEGGLDGCLFISNVAATFDKELMYQHGVKMGAEQRAKGVSVTLGPVMNLARAPEGGRIWEAAGGDPFLTSFVASLQVEGIQSQGVIATAKHEHNRNGGDSVVDLRTFHEVYLRPFKACVDAGVGAVMCSYNRINGTYACENPATLQILKGELNFQGFVMTDWWAANSTAPTANAGTDMMMPGGATQNITESLWGPNLVAAVRVGNVSEARVTDMATRILASWIKMGQDDGHFPGVNFDSWNASASQPVNVQGNHKDHIREVGAASAVLVKNDGGALPLSGVKKIA